MVDTYFSVSVDEADQAQHWVLRFELNEKAKVAHKLSMPMIEERIRAQYKELMVIASNESADIHVLDICILRDKDDDDDDDGSEEALLRRFESEVLMDSSLSGIPDITKVYIVMPEEGRQG